MGVKKKVIVEAHCDYCGFQIDNGSIWVDWGERGIVFHWSCLQEMSVPEFIEFALERGDQMFIKVDTEEMKGVELKHIWKDAIVNPDQLREAVYAYRNEWR